MPVSPKPDTPLTAAQALKRLRDEGVTISDWAKERGLSPRIVYAVLSGNRKALRGESFRAAVALGMQLDPDSAEE